MKRIAHVLASPAAAIFPALAASLCALALAGFAQSALAQGIDVAAERARIAAERKVADDRLAADQKACRAKFAVNDCLAKARAQHREAVTALRRQEVTLNDMERKRRTVEKMKDLDERQSAKKEEDAARQREASARSRQQKEATQAERAAKKASEPHPAQAPREPQGAQTKLSPQRKPEGIGKPTRSV